MSKGLFLVKIVVPLIVSLTSEFTIAGEFRQYKNKMVENIKELTSGEDSIKLYRVHNKKGLTHVMSDIRKKNKGTIDRKSQEFIEADSIVRFIFETIGEEPQFCESLKNIDDENINECQNVLASFIKPINNIKRNKRSLLYLNGVHNGNDYKTVYVIGRDKRNEDFVVTELSI
ncbi:hypothetical protein N9B72_00735 [Bacteriovoracaceae bacterium]|nr:hypothetical protein [Bacteriovoracaceae bacterium]